MSPESVGPESSASKSASQESSRQFAELTHYCGFDWARKADHVCVVVDKAGAAVLEVSFADDADGWESFGKKLSAVAEPSKVGVAIETSCGPEVERLLAMGLAVYPMNPKAASRYRDRKSVSGAKSDFADAFCFGDGLRTDGHGWRRLRPLDPLTAELRILCRDEVALIEQRTALVNQLRATLREYYPAALEAFGEWNEAPAWRLVLAFPTPKELAKAGKNKWNRFLHANKLYRPQTVEKRLEVFARADAFASPSPAVTAAKSLLAVSLCEQLTTLERQRQVPPEDRAAVQGPPRPRPVRLAAGGGAQAGAPAAGGAGIRPRRLRLGPGPAVFRGHGAGDQTVGPDAGRPVPPGLQHGPAGGGAPVVRLQPSEVRLGRGVLPEETRAADEPRPGLRCLGQRWLKILFAMWQENKPYDEGRHTLDQVNHGSWVVELLAEKPRVMPA